MSGEALFLHDILGRAENGRDEDELSVSSDEPFNDDDADAFSTNSIPQPEDGSQSQSDDSSAGPTDDRPSIPPPAPPALPLPAEIIVQNQPAPPNGPATENPSSNQPAAQPDKPPPIPQGKGLGHHYMMADKVKVCSFDLETAGEHAGVVQMSAKLSATIGSITDEEADHNSHNHREHGKDDGDDNESTTTAKSYKLTKNKSLGLGSIFLILCISLSIFALWKYAIGAPTTFSEAKQGFKDWWSAARNVTLDDFKDVLKDGLDGFDFGHFFDNDPRVGDNNTYLWKRDYISPNNGGLRLTLLNALDDTWQQEFSDVVSDWRESTALKLTSERVEVDHNCTRIDGVMVVCNANFGATGWVGINENELLGNVIYSSVAKMNEYYLRNAKYDQRRYTMCHEIGHGFGLPHTDENPYNSDLGNCLDYTTTPQNNLYPGNVNYKKLHGMYNLYNSRRLRRETEDGRVMETHVLYLEERPWEEVERDLLEEGDSYEVLEDY